MPRKCLDCQGKDENKKTETVIEKKIPHGLKRFSFPREGISVLAKDLTEANEMMKIIKEKKESTK